MPVRRALLEVNLRPRCTLRKKNNLGNCFSAISNEACFCQQGDSRRQAKALAGIEYMNFS